MVKIVVIGASGYVGQATVNSLLTKKKDDEVSKVHPLVESFCLIWIASFSDISPFSTLSSHCRRAILHLY